MFPEGASPRDTTTSNPWDLQVWYLKWAVYYRELWYQGLDEAVEVYGPEDAPIKWGEQLKAKQLSANNKWHFLQSLAYGLVAAVRLLSMTLAEHREHNKQMQELQQTQISLLRDISRKLK